MKKRTKLLLALALLVILMVWTLWGNTALEINTYSITGDRIPESFSGFRIAQISDLHNAEFGQGNEKLLAMLSGTEPDIIVLTGDLIDSRRTNVEIALEFCRSAVKIAPVYYVNGNHESRVTVYGELKAGLQEAGVTVLENEKLTISREGSCITLMGLVDPSFRAGEDAAIISSALAELQGDSDGYAVLLAHRPELFEVYADYDIDLVFSGHAHGGQFRLPLIGGLVAPNQGLFPKYDAGRYTEHNTTMMVSRGVGNSIIPIRFHNRPEIILVELGHQPG